MRCIFLCADGLDSRIQEFRKRHDPLGIFLEPHITLVFPFKMNVSDEALVDHVLSQVSSISSFAASIHYQPKIESDYLYLEVEEGAAQIKALRNFLYTGLLEQLRQDRLYIPHITIGRVHPENAQYILEDAKGLQFETRFMISRLKVERIGSNGESKIISEHNLEL